MKRIGIALILLGFALLLAAFGMGYAYIFGAGSVWSDAAWLTFGAAFLAFIAASFPGWWDW